ncbi:MAG TPA: ribose 5-phosphate isomerase A [Nitrososphaerales archaeon]|nr:ribose 5-phosphate isomerase A [Nitrososphaerales archaeon]
MDKQRQALRGVAEELSKTIAGGTTVGLGSGSTVAILIEELSPLLLERKVAIKGVPTSTQIELVATRSGIGLAPFTGRVDLVLDGADQVDGDMNLIKGGGGALLREKVLMGSSKRTVIVADERKFARLLCEKGVKVPVEVVPMARESAKTGLSKLGGVPEERLLPKGYPFFTENGNVILDTAFEPISEPQTLEMKAKAVPGVAEVGIFTFKPITVYRLGSDGSFEALEKQRDL